MQIRLSEICPGDTVIDTHTQITKVLVATIDPNPVYPDKVLAIFKTRTKKVLLETLEADAEVGLLFDFADVAASRAHGLHWALTS